MTVRIILIFILKRLKKFIEKLEALEGKKAEVSQDPEGDSQ